MAEPSGHSPLKRHLASIAVPATLALLAYLRGRPLVASALLAAGTIFLLLRIASRGRLDALIQAGSRLFGRALLVVLTTGFEIVVIVPVALGSRLLRQDVLRPSLGWSTLAPEDGREPVHAPVDSRSFGREPRRSRSSPLVAASDLLVVLALVPILLAADLAIGSLWTRRTPAGDRLTADGFGPVIATDRVAVAGGAPWTESEARTFRAVRLQYWPFETWRTAPATGPVLTTDGWVRRSTGAAPVGTGPTVGFFGGSACFGVGQDDAHTVPSLIAALAHRDGLAIIPTNECQPRWTTWQSWLRFDQATKGSARPDLALFLTGIDDLYAGSGVELLPGHVDLDTFQARLGDPSGALVVPKRTTLREDAMNAYQDHSLFVRVWRNLFGQPTPDASGPARAKAATPNPTVAEATSVYRRGRELATWLGRQRSITTTFAWEPTPKGTPNADAVPRAVGNPTVDLSQLLDHRQGEFKTDGSLTGAGAERLATALWATLRPQVSRWYRAHR